MYLILYTAAAAVLLNQRSFVTKHGCVVSYHLVYWFSKRAVFTAVHMYGVYNMICYRSSPHITESRYIICTEYNVKKLF